MGRSEDVCEGLAGNAEAIGDLSRTLGPGLFRVGSAVSRPENLTLAVRQRRQWVVHCPGVIGELVASDDEFRGVLSVGLGDESRSGTRATHRTVRLSSIL